MHLGHLSSQGTSTETLLCDFAPKHTYSAREQSSQVCFHVKSWRWQVLLSGNGLIGQTDLLFD